MGGHKTQSSCIYSLFSYFFLIFRDLTQNEMVSVDKTTFTKLPKLRHLLLDNNKISYVEEGAFAYLSSLQILYVYQLRHKTKISDIMQISSESYSCTSGLVFHTVPFCFFISDSLNFL